MGIEGMIDLPRSGQPLKLNAEKIDEFLTLTTWAGISSTALLSVTASV